MPFRFIHTADLHLDSPLKSLALRDAGLSALIGTATRTALERIVDLCLAEAVDALLIAGDLYDGATTSMKTAGFLLAQMRRLEVAGVRVFLIRGNHDAEARITRELVFPGNVTLFGPKVGCQLIEQGGLTVALHGISFQQPHAPASLLPLFQPPLRGAVNIGMMHTSLNGAAGHDPYAPVSVAELQASGFDYWALGHIHQRAVHTGACLVVMPGMPQGRDIGEMGSKSVTLVTIADDGTLTAQERPTSVADFARVTVDVGGIADWRDLVEVLRAAVLAARQTQTAPHLVLRPVLSGASPLAWRIARDGDLLLTEAAEAALATGSVWIDKLERDVLPAAATGGGALADLADLIAAAPAAGLVLEADTVMDDLRKALPRDLRGLLGDTPETMAALRDGLMRDGAAGVLARLTAGEG